MSIAILQDSPRTLTEQFQRDGYFILENVIPEDTLQMLREECSYFIGYADAELDMKGQATIGLSHRGKRYFIANQYRKSPRLWKFLFSPLMAQVAQAALGPDVYLFHEQWVVKGAEQGMKFAWHQDSGYVRHGDRQALHRPYVTCWCTLDDVSEVNGTVYLLPHDRGGTRDTVFDHNREEGSNDLIGYSGDDPGDAVEVPAGSIVAFTSVNFHSSGMNTTPHMRRTYLAQYSAEPITKDRGTNQLWGAAIPFVKAGQNIYDPNVDWPEGFEKPEKLDD